MGVNDYGIYSLIAGVISMLSFINNALTVTTFRYLSYNRSTNNSQRLKSLFSTSLIIHVFTGLLIVLAVAIVGLFLFDGFFNISAERVGVAKIIYHLVAVVLYVTFITSPFRALFISRENIVYTSAVEVIDGILKVLIALLLYYFDGFDKLIYYGVGILTISVIDFFAYFLYAKMRYDECTLNLKLFDKGYVKELTRFAGWTIYSTGCIVGRTQGVAIVLNKFFSTAANAAFGIALQVSGAVSFVSTSFSKAIEPQIFKAEGKGDRETMLALSFRESKFATLILAAVAIPCIFEMETLLHIWLGEIPEYAVLFCQVIMATALIDQTTTGLGTANQAIGKIRNYSICVNTIKILTVPAFALALCFGMDVSVAIWLYFIFEGICAFSRIIFLKFSAGMSITDYLQRVILKLLAPISILILLCLTSVLIELKFRFIITLIIPNIIYLITVYMVGLSVNEKKYISDSVEKIRLKYNKKD